MEQNTTGAAGLSLIARMTLNAQLLGHVKEMGSITPGAPMAVMKLAMASSKILAVLAKLGIDLNAKPRAEKAFELEGGPEPVEVPRTPTAKFYDFDPNRKHGDRKKDNAAAMELLAKIDAGEVDGEALTDAQKEALARYSGTGGNLVGADGKKGSAYEYYTPKPIAAGMWDMLGELGFKGGKVLDPCSGVGIFGAAAPASAAMDTIELNETSGRINRLVNGGPGYNAIVSPFEAVASRTPDEIYDAVISNVPFGGVHDRGANRKMDEKYQDEPLETYFILRSLEKLKPGGLAAFIVPPRIVSAKGGREEKLRIAMSYMAEFMGAYRLPNSVFGTADADTITDVIVLRKFGRDAAEKIAELTEQNPAMLVEAKVQWTEFVGGDYFKGEGRRFVLGEFVAKDPTKFRDVDRVVSDQSVANIAKLLRKFPGSRIDWAKLEATETEPIVYNEGDTITMAGQTLQMRDGRWVALGASQSDSRFDELGQVLSTPLVAVTNAVDWAQARDFVNYLRERSMDVQMPDWLRAAHRDIQACDDADRPYLWSALSVGLATVQATQQHSATPGFNYAEEYPVLHEAVARVAVTARKSPASFSRNSKAAMSKVGIVYDRKRGYSDLWMGRVNADVMDGVTVDEEQQVQAIKYRTNGVTIDVAELKGIYGDAFDPMADDGWCLSADGSKATKADDYYTGNLAGFMARIDAEIAAADGPLRQKLARQKEMAASRVSMVDPGALKFNLFTPFATIQEKAEFLRRFVHPAFDVAINNNGDPYIVYEGPEKSTAEQLNSRLASYISGDAGGRGVRSLTIQGKKLGVSDKEALAILRSTAMRMNAQFDQWVKANPVIMERLRQQANDPSRLYFNEVEDGSPVQIEGVNADWSFHGYQNSFIRKQSHGFGGINGFDVGGGKTATAAACVQYVQSIGIKKKTMIVVPNTVLSNWRKELLLGEESPGHPKYKPPVYTSGDDCLFIGLDVNEKTGKATVSSSNYARDFTRVLENKHRKIFCTLEAFKTIPLKDETMQNYDTYLMQVDPSYAGSEKKSESERADSKRAEATSGTGEKSSAIPYFEDMGIDSLVLDEAHNFKNSKQTIEFSGAKFLSVAEASQRGLDVQVKAWYIRDLTPSGDGVLSLTATPITNSPLEIYSMLTLAAGEKKVHDLCMGVQGADAFMDTMCVIEEEEEFSIDGQLKNYKVFRGLQNVELLRTALRSIATIKGPEDFRAEGQNIVLPDAEEQQTAVKLPQPVVDKLTEYKMAYRAARALTGAGGKNAPDPTPEELDALARVKDRYGENDELVAHPFNLINKMTLLIADPELDERATFYTVQPAQRSAAEKAIAAFNALGKIEDRALPGPHTTPEAIVGTKTIKDDGLAVILKRIKVEARMVGDSRIVVDTLDKAYQAEFEKQADKAGLDLDCSIPPKLAALLENVRKEEAHPRSQSGRVKQLIFCDVLPMHNKIKRVLVKHAGFLPSQIVFVTGMDIKNPEQMQGVQDGFNADGADNKYRAVVANEKAEVGINLQKGTQAIHHLTIGWTPDSQIQRNGRGVRQGNSTAIVNVYHYDADGTFDEYKRKLTNKKGDWISAVMSKDGGNEVSIAGGMTTEQYDEMIESMGDANALRNMRDRAEMRERLARADSARARQVINLQTAESQRKFVKQYSKSEAYVAAKMMALYDARIALKNLQFRRSSTKSATALVKLETRIAELEANITGMRRDLESSATFVDYRGNARTIDEVLYPGSYATTEKKKRENVERQAQNVNVKEGSDLHQEWEAEMAQAQGMIDEAFKDFERISASGQGGYPAEVLQYIRDGDGVVIDGRPYTKGMFVRDAKGNLGLIANRSDVYRAGRMVATVQAVATGKFEVVMPGTPEYEGALNEAAALDDQLDGVRPDDVGYLFSSVLPAVAERRTKKTMVRYRFDAVALPSPHFPYPVDPGATGISDGLKKIIESQAGVVAEWDGSNVVIASDAGVQKLDYHAASNISIKLRTLVERAVSMGVQITPLDVSTVIYDNPSGARTVAPLLALHGKWNEEEFERLIDAAKTADEAQDIGREALAKSVPWLDVTGLSLSEVAPLDMRSYYNFRIRKLQKAAEDAAAAASGGVVMPAPVADSSVDMKATVWVKPSNERDVRVYFNDVQSGVKVFASDAGTGILINVKAGKYGDGVVAPHIRASVVAKVEERIEKALGTKNPPFEVLVAAAGGMPAQKSAEELTGGVTDIGGVAPNAAGQIGITGDTRTHMGKIKELAVAAGGRAIWNGRGTRWEVPAKTWALLGEKYPEAVKALQVVPC